MDKQIWIYDVVEAEESWFSQLEGEPLLFSASPPVKPCIGCFSCWIKTPGRCVIQDRCSVIPSYFAQCDTVNIVSPILYGGYSQNIKAVLDRSIGYLLPYFRLIHHEMHHQMRYPRAFQFHVYFYGPCDERERDIARRLVKANSINLGAESYTVHFFASVAEIRKEWL